jgi:hypothetical protein
MDRSVRTSRTYARCVPRTEEPFGKARVKRVDVGVLFPVAFVLCPTAYHFHSSHRSTTSTVSYNR